MDCTSLSIVRNVITEEKNIEKYEVWTMSRLFVSYFYYYYYYCYCSKYLNWTRWSSKVKGLNEIDDILEHYLWDRPSHGTTMSILININKIQNVCLFVKPVTLSSSYSIQCHQFILSLFSTGFPIFCHQMSQNCDKRD